MKNKADRVSIKIPTELHREIDIRSASTRTPIYVLIQQAWDAFNRQASPDHILPREQIRRLPDTQPLPVSSTITPSDPSSEWLSLLSQILSSGHAIAIQAITHNLRAFAALVSVDRRGKHDDYPVPNPEDLDKEIERILASGRDDPPRGITAPTGNPKRRPA